MSAEHTKGPWAAGVRAGGFIDITHQGNEPGAITRALCRVQSRITWIEESQANARLIAAAPDLIAALKVAQRAINCMKVEAETAAMGDEQMMLEAMEAISGEALEADMAIREALENATGETS